MSALTAEAKEQIRAAGMSVAAYVRAGRWIDVATGRPTGRWHGDACGCTDDRCIGYHHDERDDCQCLPVLIARAKAETAVPA